MEKREVNSLWGEYSEDEQQRTREEVIAEREQKIQNEVEEIKKVFFCDLCSKQYKLAVEFESHLSSYDHNHLKEIIQRFKEMKEMYGGSSRDDRQIREQLWEEKEMAKFAQMADANKQQQQQGDSTISADVDNTKSSTTVINQEQRQTIKFGFSKPNASKKASAGASMNQKKPKVAKKMSSVFGNGSDDE